MELYIAVLLGLVIYRNQCTQYLNALVAWARYYSPQLWRRLVVWGRRNYRNFFHNPSKMSSTEISSKSVGFRDFWSNPASIGLWDGKSRDGVSCLSTDPLNFKADVSRDAWVTVPPATGLPASLGGTAPVQFRINPGTCNYIMECYLDLTVMNTDPVNAITPIAFPFFTNRLELGCNANPSPYQILYPEWLYSAYSQYSNEDMAKACFANQLNMSPSTWGSETAIPPSSSVTYSMPLHGAFFSHGEVNAMAISGALMISWYQNATPVVAAVGNPALLTQTFTQLRIRSRFDPAYDLARLKLLKKLPQLCTYLKTPIQQYYNTLVGGQNTVVLNGVTDFTMGLKVFIRQATTYQQMTPSTVAGVTLPGIRNFVALESINGASNLNGFVDVLAASGTSIYGISNIITPAYLRSQDMISPKSYGQMYTVVPIYELAFPQGADYPRALERAVQGGGYLFTGSNERLILTVPATSSAVGTVAIVTVIPMQYAVILQTPEGYLRDLGDGSSSSSI